MPAKNKTVKVTLKGKTAAKQQLVTRSQKVDANDAYRLAKGKK